MTRPVTIELLITATAVVLGALAFLLHLPALEFVALLVAAASLGMALVRFLGAGDSRGP